ncbi:hypothetical protein TWF281_003040 [Arthrobotrys megalospora]
MDPPRSPGKRVREEDVKSPPPDPSSKRLIVPKSPGTPRARAYEMIVSDPPEVYGAGPFSIHRTKTPEPRGSSVHFSSSPFHSSPIRSSSVSPISSSPAQAKTVSTAFKSSPPQASKPPFKAKLPVIFSPEAADAASPLLTKPLQVAGDTSVEAGEQCCSWYEDGAGTFCSTSTHPVAGSILPFEDTTRIDATQFHQLLSPTARVDTTDLEDFLGFIKNTVSRCVVCQFSGQNSPIHHHIRACPKVAGLGTFMWTSYISNNNSSHLDQAVFAIAAVFHLVAPSNLPKISEFLKEEIPTNYLEFKAWCLQPQSMFIDIDALKAHSFCNAIRTLQEFGIIFF